LSLRARAAGWPPRAACPQVGAGARAVDAGRGFGQGALQRTDQPFDVAIQGEGFIKVTLPDGREALTRDGSLHVDGTGKP
jgi:flagellar basal-body rod protein FlgG